MRLGRRSFTVRVCALWVCLKWQIPFQSQQREMGAPGHLQVGVQGWAGVLAELGSVPAWLGLVHLFLISVGNCLYAFKILICRRLVCRLQILNSVTCEKHGNVI